MSGKFYPSQVVGEQGEDGVHRQTWRGSVTAILLQEEADAICALLEDLYGRDDVSEELGGAIEEMQELIIAIVRNGQNRMNRLHSVLGAFDVGLGGEISKPEEDRVNLPRGSFSRKPNLELVKNNEKDKGES